MRSQKDITQTIERYADTVLRVCRLYLKEPADAEDAFQDCFVRYARYEADFEGEEHKKAWLIRVASNLCKDQLKRASSRDVAIDEIAEPVSSEDVEREAMGDWERSKLMDALHSLDEKYRIVLYMRYFEGMSAVEIGQALDIAENTVHTRVSRGKMLLKEVLGGEF